VHAISITSQFHTHTNFFIILSEKSYDTVKFNLCDNIGLLIPMFIIQEYSFQNDCENQLTNGKPYLSTQK